MPEESSGQFKPPTGKIGCALGALLAITAVMFFSVGLNSPGVDEAAASETGTGLNIEKPANDDEWIKAYKEAEAKMQVEWELIASVTQQESGQGHNFGTCSYYPPAPGGHVLVSGNGLRSREDKSAFTRIAAKLNIPQNTGVSCNPRGSNGGAMGYTQFMPREWAGGAGALQTLLGHYANPWNATDAVIMAARLLKAKVDIGQGSPMPVDLALYKRAANRYYGCTSCFYGDEVINRYLKIKRTQSLR